MGFRIQPQEIEIPHDEPFKNDCLGRKEPADILARILKSIDGPCVLAVDAPWGAGKTTFLNMLARHLRNRQFPVVEFNAWETDFTSDPFLALSEELTSGVREYTDGPLRDEITKVKAAAKEVVRLAVPGAIRLLTAGLLDISPLVEKEAGKALASIATKRLSEYPDATTTLRSFRASLGEFATRLTESRHGLPLILVIDELDRCRPSYAVELLETAKHLFAVDRVVFVLGVNRSELAHSIRAVYGGQFDAIGYLRRFIDLDFRLPEAEREPFIEATLRSAGIEDYFKNRPAESTPGDDYGSVCGWLLAFFVSSDLGLRHVAQSIHRLGLVFASLKRDRRSLARAATVALVMRTLEPDLFWRFTQGDVEDRQAVQVMLGRVPGLSGHHSELLEAILIVAAIEIEHPDQLIAHVQPSPLLAEYREVARKARDAAAYGDDSAALRAMAVVEAIGRFEMEQLHRGVALGFPEAARRVELLSASLLDDDAHQADGVRGH